MFSASCLLRRNGLQRPISALPRHSLPLSAPLARYSRHGIRRLSSQAPQFTAPSPEPPKRSLLRRTATVLALALVCTSGFLIAAYPGIKVALEMLNPPSAAETLLLYTPTDDFARRIDTELNSHPLAISLRSNPDFIESRPHLKIPPSQRPHSLTAGTLLGPGRVVVPPVVWTEKGGKSLVAIFYLGEDLCGYPGVVHGGFLATILDEGLGRCCMSALPNKVGMTANLSINYRAPTMAGRFVVLKATTKRVEGRKAWVEGRIETLEGDGREGVVLADAEGLFIEPKQAATMAAISPIASD